MTHRLEAAALGCAVIACVAWTSSGARAHAFLHTATPAVGSTLRVAPTQVTIGFTESVEPAFSDIVVQGPGGARVDRGGVHLAGDVARLAVALTPLGPGRYVVTWHAVATDTHHTEGSFSFTIAP